MTQRLRYIVQKLVEAFRALGDALNGTDTRRHTDEK
jgi:hypothetical protein